MNHVSNFHIPLPGEIAIYYCWNCKKNFSAKVPEDRTLSLIFNSRLRVRCPDCKTYCSLSPMIQY